MAPFLDDKKLLSKALNKISKKFDTDDTSGERAIKTGIELATLLDDKETLNKIYDKVKSKAELEAMTSIALALGGEERVKEVRACIKDTLDKTEDLDEYIDALNQKYRLDKRFRTELLLGPQQKIEKITLEGKDYTLDEAGNIDKDNYLTPEEKKSLDENLKIAPFFNLPLDIRANIAEKMGASKKDIKDAEERNKKIIQDGQNSSSQKASSSGLSVSA